MPFPGTACCHLQYLNPLHTVLHLKDLFYAAACRLYCWKLEHGLTVHSWDMEVLVFVRARLYLPAPVNQVSRMWHASVEVCGGLRTVFLCLSYSLLMYVHDSFWGGGVWAYVRLHRFCTLFCGFWMWLSCRCEYRNRLFVCFAPVFLYTDGDNACTAISTNTHFTVIGPFEHIYCMQLTNICWASDRTNTHNKCQEFIFSVLVQLYLCVYIFFRVSQVYCRHPA